MNEEQLSNLSCALDLELKKTTLKYVEMGLGIDHILGRLEMVKWQIIMLGNTQAMDLVKFK